MFGQSGHHGAPIAATAVIWMSRDGDMGEAGFPNLVAGNTTERSISEDAKGRRLMGVKTALLDLGGIQGRCERMTNRCVIGSQHATGICRRGAKRRVVGIADAGGSQNFPN